MLRLLGPPAVAGRGATELPRKAFLIAAMLDLAPSRRLTREAIAARLWEGAGGDTSGGLRQLLLRTRRWEVASGLTLLRADRSTLWRDDDTVASDLTNFLSMRGVDSGEALERLTTLYGGDLLAGVDDPGGEVGQWIAEKRTELRDRFLRLGLAGAERVGGQRGIDVLGRLLGEAPYSDDIARALLLAVARAARPDLVKSVYSTFASRLAKDLQDEPEPRTKALLRELLPSDRSVPAMPSGIRVGPAASLISVPRLLILPPSASQPELKRSDDLLAQSLMDEVTFTLSRARTFAVFAPHTARQLAVRPFPDDAPYGADYVLSTRLRSGLGGVLSLLLMLTRVATHEVLLSEELRFAPQDLEHRRSDLVSAMALRFANTVERAELSHYRSTGAASAYVHYLLGAEWMKTTTLSTLRRARRHFKRAVQLSPRFAPARSMMARSLSLEWVMLDRKEDEPILAAIDLARRAIDEDPLDPSGHRELGHALIYLDRVDEAVTHLEDAVGRGPNHADVLMNYADGLVHAGMMPKAKAAMDHALELNPLAPDLYYWIAGTADFFLGDYASASLKLSTMQEPQSAARFVAAVEAMNGNLPRAHAYRDAFLGQHPEFRVADYHVPLRKKAHRELYLEALRVAGFH
jgi:DNA-binding SARP family transcriptional activator/tetratricopeptide (TPR) repeat protein